MNDYEARKEARIERLRARAAGARSQAEQRYGNFRRTSDAIPFGQPILVGHHSERRHRRELGRMDRDMSKVCELHRHAEDLERRAAHAESNSSISSDDPSAVERLSKKLVALEKAQTVMKGVNAALRKRKTDEQIAEAFPPLTAAQVAKVRQPDFAGRTGFADYALKNNNAEIRRVKARIAQLTIKQTEAPSAPEQIGEVRIEESDNRVRVYFPGKPAESVRTELKANGFRWSPTAGAWQRHASGMAWARARDIAAKAAV
jgi:hypothetical protein